MHVYTMGTRAYAEEVCAAIDPDGKLFGGRILSRDESGSEQLEFDRYPATQHYLRSHAEKPATSLSLRYIYGSYHRRSRGCLGMESKPYQGHSMFVILFAFVSQISHLQFCLR